MIKYFHAKTNQKMYGYRRNERRYEAEKEEEKDNVIKQCQPLSHLWEKNDTTSLP